MVWYIQNRKWQLLSIYYCFWDIITLFIYIIGKTPTQIRNLYLTRSNTFFTGSIDDRSTNFDAFLKKEFEEQTVMTDLGETPRYGSTVESVHYLKLPESRMGNSFQIWCDASLVLGEHKLDSQLLPNRNFRGRAKIVKKKTNYNFSKDFFSSSTNLKKNNRMDSY